jgi:iron-sulfur cluster repair protein YtfE (RIC family)
VNFTAGRIRQEQEGSMEQGQAELELMVNELVKRYPATGPVFRKHSMDTCCGGWVPVRAAAERDGVDLEVLTAELLQAMGETA